MSNLPNTIPRNLLAEVFNNNARMIKAFEDLIKQVNTEIPADFESVQALTDSFTASITALQVSVADINADLAVVQSNITTIQGNITSIQAVLATLGTMSTQDANSVAITGGTAIIDTLTIHNADFISTDISLNDYSGVSIGTLTNAPSAGNPTKWVKINDNGTDRFLALF